VGLVTTIEMGYATARYNSGRTILLNALGGQIENILSVVRGVLLPSGQPRFIAPVTVPVFRSPKK